jgi:predicted DNA-binding transcriptional regulator AlpA
MESVPHFDRNPHLTENEVAKILRVSVATMRRRRLQKQPPNWIKIGASVRYTPQSISAFLKSLPAGGGHQEVK